MRVGALLFVVAFLPAAPVFAHGGGLDSSGCHQDRRSGGYHCHRAPAILPPALWPGAPLPAVPTQPPPVPADLLFSAPELPQQSSLNKWLFVAFVFDPASSGLKPTEAYRRTYETEEACNDAGETFRSLHAIQAELKSLSFCVKQAWFDEQGWKWSEM